MLSFVSTPIFIGIMRVKIVKNRLLLHCVWTIFDTFGVSPLLPDGDDRGYSVKNGNSRKNPLLHTHPDAHVHCHVHGAGAHPGVSNAIDQKQRILHLLTRSAALRILSPKAQFAMCQEGSWDITLLWPPHHKGILAVERLPHPLSSLQPSNFSCVLPAPSFQILLLNQSKINSVHVLVPSFWAPVFLYVGMYFFTTYFNMGQPPLWPTIHKR